MTSPSDLEREIALLTWHLKMARLTPAQSAAYHNSLVGKNPVRGLEARVTDLIAELKQW